jgi:hypothetical protein
MSTFNTSMFESIKDALTSEDKQKNNGLADIIQLKPGNTYTVRLLPNVVEPKKTFFHHFVHGWNSFETGKYVSALSPSTFGERDPIAEERYKILRNGTDEEKEKVKAIRRTEQWFINVYVIDDPQNAENNGKVKVLRYGKQLHTIINNAISGDDAEEFGSKIFDLTKEGVNFKIKVEKQGDFPSYTSSRFTTAGRDLGLSKDKQEEIYNSIKDLETIYRLKTTDELKQMFDEHYLCISTDAETPKPAAKLPAADEAVAELSGKVKQPSAPVTEDVDIDELLKDL